MAKNNKRKWLIIGLALLIIALLAAVWSKRNSRPSGIPVTVEKVEKRTISEKVSASGRIFPETEIKISSDVSGEIVELYVEEGDSVVVGQILAKIDPESYVSTVERGQASVNNTKAQLATSRSQIENAKAQKEQILAQLENARNIHARNTQLKADGVISEMEFEQSKSTLDGLQANLKAAEASIRSAQENAKGAQFAVKSAEATLKELKTSLNRTTIKAPTSGIVSSLSVEQGERVVGTIQMTGTEMMRIANLNSMEVQVEVSENDILKVSNNDPVEIEVDAYLDKKFEGIVTQIANSASNTTGIAGTSLNTDQVTNFIVKVRINPNSYADLVTNTRTYPFRPGMSASVDIVTDIQKDVTTIPIQAVTMREKNEDDSEKDKKDLEVDDLKEVIFVYEADTARMVEVKTGIQDDEYIEVLSELPLDSEIVSGPYSAVSKKLKQGSELTKKEKEKDEEDED